MSNLGNPLNDIPLEKVPNFVQILKKELPRSLFIINLIETCRNWKLKNDRLQLSLLYTEQSMKTGVFISVLKSGCLGAVVSLYAFDNHDNDLERALKHLKLDLKTVVNFEGVAKKHWPLVERLIADRGLKIKMAYPLVLFSMPIEEALKIDVECSDDVIIGPLTENHADEMYEIWIANDMYTVEALKNAIVYNDESACGIFCKKSGDLLARCVRSHSGVVAALQTVEKARNKGYAKLLIRYVSKKMAEKGILPCSYTAEENPTSLKLHRSCGFEDIFADDVVIGPLNEHHADEIYKIWIRKDFYTVQALKDAIVYTNQPVGYDLLARCIRNQSGVLAALQTIEEARNKGYAKLLLCYIAKRIAEKGILPCSYTAVGNPASLKLHRSCGYKDTYELYNFNMAVEMQ